MDLRLRRCKHEPCVYCNPNYKGEQIYFPCQVDNFAISSTSKYLALETINKNDDHMIIKVKPLGMIDRFNGVDVHQTKFNTNLHDMSYIKKILQDRIYMDKHSHTLPIPKKILVHCQ